MTETAVEPVAAEVDQWLASFEEALASGDSAAAADLFAQDGFWRDLVAFTWNIKTLEGPEEIRAMLDATLARVKPSDWRTTEPPDAADGITEQDAHLAGHILEAGRALVVGVNKWDAASKEARETIKRDLDRERAHEVMDEIMRGEATPAQIGAFLVALRLKGETADEIAGCAEAMRGHVLAVRPQRRLPRADLRVEGRREAGREDLALPADVVVLTCQTVDGPQDLAMEPSTLTGFLSWVESAPGVR